MEWKNVEIRDENGEGFELIQHEELIMPEVFQHMQPEKRLEMIRKFKCRKDNILICSHPKTGTHWLSNLIYFLITPGPVETMTTVQPKLLDFIPLDEWDEAENSRILHSHFQINRLPIEHLENSGKIVVLTRDPRDAMVSLKYHIQNFDLLNRANLSWNYFFDTWIRGKCACGSYFDYYNSWEKAMKENKNLNVLIVHFEDLKNNGLKELQRIQEFVEVNNSEERLKQILDRCTLTKMKSDIDTGKVESLLLDKEGKSFLYRKGEIGEWKRHFTVTQSEYFDKIMEDQLKDSIFKL